jgi:hypothetical protein
MLSWGTISTLHLFLLVDIMIFFYGCLAVWNKLETCELMEFVYVLDKRMGR